MRTDAATKEELQIPTVSTDGPVESRTSNSFPTTKLSSKKLEKIESGFVNVL